MISEFNQGVPDIEKAAFVSDSAVIVGAVSIGEGSSVWPQAVLRGDADRIVIGEKTNIQDASVLHPNFGKPVIIADRVTVGHGAVLHGCEIASDCLIGMGSVILDGANVGENCIVGASALVPEGAVLKAGGLYLGVPARRVREINQTDTELIRKRALEYIELSLMYRGKRV